MESDNDRTESFVALTKETKIGHYTIIEKIGAGGMGEVYLAEDTTLKRKVALKFLPANMCPDEDCRNRFKREAQAAAQLNHPNIVHIYEVSEFMKRPFFAMEHVEGESLYNKIKEKKITINEAVKITKQICEGLNEAHTAGIVHRDIKPANIIIDKNGRSKILDFGLATILDAEKLTKTGSTLGTVGYMSPEQVNGEKVDARSDLFSVGVILYEMITGQRPFKAEYEAATFNAILHEAPEPLSRYKSGVTDDLQQIVNKALEKNRETRYQHADGMLSDLKRLQIGVITNKKSISLYWFAVAAAVVIAVIGYFIVSEFPLDSKGGNATWTDSIAVLVFRDLSPEKNQGYLCEGMTDEIIGRLSSIRQLKVTSMQSMLSFKGTELNLKEIGKKLGVKNILEGSIQKEGDSIRVRAQLIRVEDDAHIWSEKYIKKTTSIFAVQDEISRNIVNVMKVTFAGVDETIVTKRGTNNIEAYNAYMRGRYFWRKRTEKDLKTAIKYFNEAISLDTAYALAYCGLGDAWIQMPGFSNVTEKEAYPKAKDAINRAIKLDENSAECHATLGQILYRMGEWDKAEKEYLISINLNPGYSWSHLWYATLATLQGKMELRKQHLDIAFELDPLSLSVLTEISRDYFNEGNLEKMIEISDRRIEIEPSFQQSYIDLAYLYGRKGDTANALATLSRFVELNSDYWLSHCVLGWNYGMFGMFDKAREELKKSIDIAPDFWKTHFWLGAHLLERESKFEEAESYLLRAMKLDSNQNAPHQKYGKLLSLTGHMEQAEKHLKRAVELAPYDVFPNIEYGWFLSSALNRHEEAIKYFNRVIELNPYHGQTYNTMAFIYDKIGDLEKTIWAIDKAIAISPTLPGFIQSRARFLFHAGMFDSAAVSFNEYLKLVPQDENVLWELDDCYTFSGQYHKADSIYNYFISHSDSIQRGWGRYNQIMPLLHQGKFKKAIELLQNGIEIDKQEIPNSWPLLRKYYHCSLIYLNYLDQPELAKSFADSAREVYNHLSNPNPFWMTTINGITAIANAKLGRFDETIKILNDDYLSIDSSQNDRLNNYFENMAEIMRIKRDYDSSVVLMEKIYTPTSQFRTAIKMGQSYLADGSINKAVIVFEKAMSRYDDNRRNYPERSVIGHFYLAQAYEAAGRTDDAIKQYEIFLDIWKNADEGLSSVGDAKKRLSELKKGI